MTHVLFEDVYVGEIRFSAQGCNIEFEIGSTYDGRILARLVCLDAMSISIQNPDADKEREEFLFGSYIALVRVEKLKREDGRENCHLVMESGGVWIEIVCRVVERHDLPT